MDTQGLNLLRSLGMIKLLFGAVLHDDPPSE
jgi:hypothetical protein